MGSVSEDYRIPTLEGFRGWFAGVGSRDTPPEVLTQMELIATQSYSLGFALSSGGAPGADTAFYLGAVRSPNYQRYSARVYLPDGNFNGHRDDPERGFFNAQLFPTFEAAKPLAYNARGSFEGLFERGINLHTRNVFQILGHTLKAPVSAVVFWAIQVGKKGKVKGGTNTAVALALSNGIPVINLYTEEGQRRAENFLALKPEGKS